jgi:hypothetical protein
MMALALGPDWRKASIEQQRLNLSMALNEFPALRRWVWEFRHLSGLIGMAGILVSDPAIMRLEPK